MLNLTRVHVMRCISAGAAFLLWLAAVASATAQAAPSFTGTPAVDSANAARAAFRAANEALARDDLRGARAAIARAHSAWPTHQSYAWAVAYTDALASDTSALLSSLREYALLGLGRDLHADTLFSRFLGRRDFADVALQHDANRARLKRSTTIATLRDSTTFPEGVDFDPQTGSFFVASVRNKTIIEVRTDGTERTALAPGQPSIGAILGVRVDTLRNVLWATTSGIPQAHGYVAADSGIASLLRIRKSDGVIEARYDLPPSQNGHTLGDLAIGPGGDVFFSDSNEPFLYRLTPGATALTRITSPLFRNLQGIAPAADGKHVYVADYLHGLLRVDPATNQVIRLADAPRSTSLGCDGIVLYNHSIIGIQNGVSPPRVMRFELAAGGDSISSAEVLDRDTELATEPTIGTLARGSFVYVANSQWDEYDAKGVPVAGSRLRRPLLLAVPLTPPRSPAAPRTGTFTRVPSTRPEG
jgi:DNA-binding beta-propeller fold protein YncE